MHCDEKTLINSGFFRDVTGYIKIKLATEASASILGVANRLILSTNFDIYHH